MKYLIYKITNKNQKEYRPGDCKRVKPNSNVYKELIDKGWLSIDNHKLRQKAESCY